MSIESSHLRVPPGLEGSGNYIEGVATTILDELTMLEAKLAPVAANWTGEAHQYYQDHQQMWNVAADGLFGPEGVLGIIAHVMKVNWHNYSDAELANTNTWKH